MRSEFSEFYVQTQAENYYWKKGRCRLSLHISCTNRNRHSTFPSKRHDPETCLRMHMIEFHFFVHVKQWALMI